MEMVKDIINEIVRREKIGKSLLGRKLSDKTKLKISLSLKGKKYKSYKKPNYKYGAGMTGKKHKEITKEKMRITRLKKPFSKEALEKMGAYHKGKPSFFKGRKHTDNTKRKLSEKIKELYKNEEFIKKWIKATNIKPNRTEIILKLLLNREFPNEWKYVGDGYTFIGGKCPDFININGKKLLIEMFGDYWHRGQSGDDRIIHFSKYGFNTLIIWEHELKNELLIIDKIKSFMKMGNDEY